MNNQTQTGILPSPIRFSLTDRSQQPAIYIGQANPLNFTIANSGDKKINFTAIAVDPDANNYHFELRFRPGTLLLPDEAKLNAGTNTVKPIALNENKQSKNWKISKPVINGNDTVSVYFARSKAFILEHEAGILNDLILTLEDVRALPGAEGARGTRVELRYDNMKIGDSDALKGNLLQYVNIINHSGAQIIPLRAEIIGSDTLLNDGVKTKLNAKPTNNIKVRLLSTQPMPIDFKKGTKNSILTLSFDQGPEQFQLGADDLTSTVKVAISGSSTIKFHNPQSGKNLGKNGTVTLTPTAGFSWGKTDYLDLEITDLITNHEAGPGNIYLSYEDIPGYWDGKLVIPVEKSPINILRDTTTNTDFVGIGMNNPTAPLSIKGSKNVSNGPPDGSMRISDDTIQFGGAGNNLSLNKKLSGQSGMITANRWTDKSLNIIGVGANDKITLDNPGRAVTVYAEGGMRVVGPLKADSLSTLKDISGQTITANDALVGKTVSDQYGLVIPPGSIQIFAGNKLPGGWLWCNGRNYPKTGKYAELYKAIGDQYAQNPTGLNGPPKEDHFGIPDLIGRFPLGGMMSAKESFGKNARQCQSTGAVGGLTSVTLDTNQIPAHSHTGTTDNSGGHIHGVAGDKDNGGSYAYADGSASKSYYTTQNNDGRHSHQLIINNSGGGKGHPNTPPFLSLNFIIKY